jgi:hypothetical protein
MLCRMNRHNLPTTNLAAQLAFVLLVFGATASSYSQARVPASGDEATIQQMEGEFHQAFLAADTTMLGKLLAADFVWMHGDGELWNKDRLINEFKSGGLRYRRDEIERIKVIMYNGAAIVVAHDTRQYDVGEPFQFEYTTTYVKQAGRWRIAVFHSSYCACAKR